MKNQLYKLTCTILITLISANTIQSSDDFYAYYTKLPSNYDLLEDYREFAHPGDAEGCLEHMSDKQCRHSHVRIIENNDARVVIHWRYGLVDSRYLFSPRNDGWGTFSDEYWTIYPDGVAIRHLARGKVFSDGWVETMFLSAPGTKPEDNTELETISLINEDGKFQNLSWEGKSPEGVFENTVITRVNTKSRFRMFNIYPKGSSVEVFGGRGRLSPFHWWNHWPVSQITSDRKGFQSSSFVQEERAYHIQTESKDISFSINGSSSSPIVNPTFVLKNWNGNTLSLKIDGEEMKPGKQFRYGSAFDTSGKRYTVVWLEMNRENSVILEGSCIK